jgi:LmbE family N-acetylglucosaminyl deacetylase
MKMSGGFCVDPSEVFQGVILLAVPHMDDEMLACGGTIALLPQKQRIHAVYATDGMRAPAPIVPWLDSISADLGEVRMKESKTAMGYLGVPEANLEFLGLPEGQLEKNRGRLIRALKETIGRVDPSHILMPFRYDRHIDHLVVNQAIMTICEEGLYRGHLFEYFVYYRYRLLPAGDIRQYIHPQHLLDVNIEDVSALKRTALDHFKSQTTRFYAWQTRPNLTCQTLDRASHGPERFLRYDPSALGPAVFDRCVTWIRLAHRLEPVMKKRKDQIVALWSRGLGGKDRKGD